MDQTPGLTDPPVPATAGNLQKGHHSLQQEATNKLSRSSEVRIPALPGALVQQQKNGVGAVRLQQIGLQRSRKSANSCSQLPSGNTSAAKETPTTRDRPQQKHSCSSEGLESSEHHEGLPDSGSQVIGAT